MIVDRVIDAGFDSLEKIRAATVGDLCRAFGLAERTATTIVEGLALLSDEIDALLSLGVIRIMAVGSQGPLTGKSFCFTGELSAMKRSEAESLVKSLNGTVKTSVTKDSSFLVTNDPESGSSKNKKALSLGVAIIDENTFLDMARF